MSAYDFLKNIKGKVIDAATYELLERNFNLQAKNNQILKDNNNHLKERVASLEDENRNLKREIVELRQKIIPEEKDETFFEYEGVLFKKKNGEFSNTPFCPNCRTILSNPEKRLFKCTKCKYTKFMRMPTWICIEALKKKEI